MKKFKHGLLLLTLLIIPSISIYFIHFVIFKDYEYLLKDFISQLAFLPIYYFFSTIIIDNILAKREKIEMMRKINMVVGVFFSEFGNKFINYFTEFDKHFDEFSRNLIINSSWSESDFSQALHYVKKFNYNIDVKHGDLVSLKIFLHENRSFLVSMLENQNLIEHDTFTELILAIFHLCEELEYRNNFNNLPDSDYQHISTDMIRAYGLLIYEWLKYIQHLKSEYPYLFSLAILINPFLKEITVIR